MTQTAEKFDLEAQVKLLFPHQVDGLAFLLARKKAILADDMGLGKTRQAILALAHENPEGKFLVICPASLKMNWDREIHIVFPEDKTQILAAKVEPADSRWTIINYDILGKFFPFLKETTWDGIIFDEAHYLKNHTSKRSKECRAILGQAEKENLRAYCLTGTPLTNRPRDLFPLLQLVGHPMGKSFISFAKRYCAAFENQYGWVTDGSSNLEELAQQLQGCMIRRTKEEVLDLPPKIRTWQPVTVKKGTGQRETRRLIEQLLANRKQEGNRRYAAGAVYDSPEKADRINILGLLTKLRNQLAIAKVESSIEFIENCLDQGQKTIVFSCFDAPVQELFEKFKEEAVLLTGSTPMEKRQEAVDRFQNEPGVKVFIANLVAGGVGINLTAAAQVLFNDLDWVPANHWQAEDRAYRIGQKQLVNVNYLVADGTIDEFVQVVLEAKSNLVQAVVGGKALEADFQRNILDDLEATLGQMSLGLADKSFADTSSEEMDTLLHGLAEQRRQESAGKEKPAAEKKELKDLTAAMKKALENLAKALAGPKANKYKVESSSDKGKFYTLEEDAGDVYCTCPGFEYRGMCSHSRKLKDGINKGKIPKEYVPVELP